MHTAEDLGLYVGWISQSTSSGGFPLSIDVAGPLKVFFCGEHHGDTCSPVTRDLHKEVELLRNGGASAISALNGWFHGLVLDEAARTATIFNDRFGLNRLYFHEASRGIYFATEAKSILAVTPEARNVDPRGLAEYFRLGCVLQNRTLFPGIFLLPSASAWTLERNRGLQKGKYFEPIVWEQQSPLPLRDYWDRLTDTFGRIVRKYLCSDAPIGLSLTGGLDSRMILAWARITPNSLPCYTFGGPWSYRECSDVRIARELAQVCGLAHKTLPIGSEFFSEFPSLAEEAVWQSDGAMDVSGAVEIYANRLARSIAPVRLTGNYGSEILRGNVAFRPQRLDLSIFTPEFSRLVEHAAETYAQEARCNRLTFIAFKQVPWHHYGRFATERTQLTPRSPFLDNELVALAYRAPHDLTTSDSALLELISKGNRKFDSIRTDRDLGRNTSPLRTARHVWQEFTAKAEYAFDYGMPPWLVQTDRLMRRFHLERLFLGRHKFYHFRVWYRDQLAESLRSREFTGALPCYRDGIPEMLVRQHTAGRENRTLELHKLLSVQLINRRLGSIKCSN